MGRQSVTIAGRGFLVRSGALVDTCTIQRKTGMTEDLNTGVGTPTYATLYTGPCRVQAAAANWAGPSDVAEAALRLASFELQVPVNGSEDLRIDDRVTILTCLNDADLVGRVFSITGVSRKSHATTRKLPLLAVES